MKYRILPVTKYATHIARLSVTDLIKVKYQHYSQAKLKFKKFSSIPARHSNFIHKYVSLLLECFLLSLFSQRHCLHGMNDLLINVKCLLFYKYLSLIFHYLHVAVCVCVCLDLILNYMSQFCAV